MVASLHWPNLALLTFAMSRLINYLVHFRHKGLLPSIIFCNSVCTMDLLDGLLALALTSIQYLHCAVHIWFTLLADHDWAARFFKLVARSCNCIFFFWQSIKFAMTFLDVGWSLIASVKQASQVFDNPLIPSRTFAVQLLCIFHDHDVLWFIVAAVICCVIRRHIYRSLKLDKLTEAIIIFMAWLLRWRIARLRAKTHGKAFRDIVAARTGDERAE